MKSFLTLLVFLVCGSAYGSFKTTLSSDGQYFIVQVAFGDGDAGRISVYDTKSKQLVFEKKIIFYESCTIENKLFISQRNNLLVLALKDGSEITHKDYSNVSNIAGLDCNVSKKIIAVGIQAGPIEILNEDTLSLLKSIPVKPKTLKYELKFHPAGNLLFIGGNDFSPVFFADTNQGIIKATTKSFYHVSDMDFNESGSLAAVAFEGDRFIIFSTEDGTVKHDFAGSTHLGKLIPRFFQDKLIAAGTADDRPFLRAYSLIDYSVVWNVSNLGSWSVQSFDTSESLNSILIGTDSLYFVNPNSGHAVTQHRCGPGGENWLFSRTENVALTPYNSKLFECVVSR